jgi:hypothetical protein
MTMDSFTGGEPSTTTCVKVGDRGCVRQASATVTIEYNCAGKGNRRSVAIQSTSTSMVTNALFHSCIAARKSDR